MLKRKPKVLTPEQAEEIRTKDFFDMILPGTVKFLSDHYILGDSYRCVWAIREYPPSTEEQAILSQLADRRGVTLRIYHRLVESMEQRKIIQNATRRNKLKSGGTDVNETIEAEGNLQDVVELLANLRKNREPLLHCSVFIELKARNMDALKELQSEIAMELTRSKMAVDRLTLRQKEGFLSVLPVGSNQFGAQYERVLPASSVANLYPFNFSGKTDPKGIYIGRDKFGTNILVDFDRRAEDKTTSNILILGNSGQGKSYLLKLILANLRESGKRIICLVPERQRILEQLKFIVAHARRADKIRGFISSGIAAWEAYLHMLEHEDLSTLPLDTGEDNVNLRLGIYCDGLCQIWERHAALPYYCSLAEKYPEWREELNAAVAALDECSKYGGFLWSQGFAFEGEGLEKFRNPAARKILADEGRKAMQKDMEAVEQFKKILQKEGIQVVF